MYTAECGGRISDGISTTFDKLNITEWKSSLTFFIMENFM